MNLSCRGFARLELGQLNFDHEAAAPHRAVSEKNVTRLLHVFEIEGCHRSTETHCVDAVADPTTWAEIEKQYASLPQRLSGNVEDIPLLAVSVDCMSGLHRILAAKRFLDANDRWWTVRLFTHQAPRASLTELDLAEQYENEQAHCDGEIFRKIRQYHRLANKDGENKWWSRLTETKRKDLRQLLKDERYASVFDAMLPWPGMWTPIRLGSLHRLLTMRCDEELLNYLSHIVRTWQHLAGDKPDQQGNEIVDDATVKGLEGLVPQHSTSDAACVQIRMQEKAIFPNVHSGRDELQKKILRIPHMVPSLLTFFESLKYLEPCAKIMRSLIPTKPKKSIRASLWGSYFKPTNVLVEYAENDKRQHRLLSLEMARATAYLQLWLFALRNFPEMTNVAPRKQANTEKPAVVEPSPVIWKAFAVLAKDLGFRTSAIEALLQNNALRQLAVQLVGQCGYTVDAESHLVDELAAVLARGHNTHGIARSPAEAVLLGHRPTPPEKRYGRPFADDHRDDRQSLFLPCLYGREPLSQGHDVTTLFCKRDMLVNFLGLACLPSSTTFNSPAALATEAGNLSPNVLDCSNYSNMRDILHKDQALESRCKVLETQAQRQSEANELLRLELQRERQKSADLARVVDKASENVDTSQRDAENLTSQLLTTQIQMRQCESESRDFRQQRDEANAALAHLKEELEQLQKEYDDFREKFERVDDERFDVKMQMLNKDKMHRDETDKLIQSAKNEMSALQQRMDEQGKELQRAASEWQTLDNQISMRVLSMRNDRAFACWSSHPRGVAQQVIEQHNLCSDKALAEYDFWLGEQPRRLEQENIQRIGPPGLASEWLRHKVLYLLPRAQIEQLQVPLLSQPRKQHSDQKALRHNKAPLRLEPYRVGKKRLIKGSSSEILNTKLIQDGLAASSSRSTSIGRDVPDSEMQVIRIEELDEEL